jgi:hydroxymethylglutaryl-CoA reductase
MRLHAKNIAVMAGAVGDEIDAVAQKMADEKKVRVDRAKEIIEEIRARHG